MKKKEISVSEARQEMKDIIYRVAYGKERIFLTSHNKKMVAIIPIEDLETLESLEDLEDLHVAEERIEYVAEEGKLTDDEMRNFFGIDVQD